jgi:hypothetical protein
MLQKKKKKGKRVVEDRRKGRHSRLTKWDE